MKGETWRMEEKSGENGSGRRMRGRECGAEYLPIGEGKREKIKTYKEFLRR